MVKDRDYANLELRKDEVRTILLLRTPVNKGKRKIIAVAVDAGPGYALPAFARLRKGV
jgi:hypothetical protein